VVWRLGKTVPPTRIASCPTRPMAGHGTIDKGESGKEWSNRLVGQSRLSRCGSQDGACRGKIPWCLVSQPARPMGKVARRWTGKARRGEWRMSSRKGHVARARVAGRSAQGGALSRCSLLGITLQGAGVGWRGDWGKGGADRRVPRGSEVRERKMGCRHVV
jgi:hypothetical protein